MCGNGAAEGQPNALNGLRADAGRSHLPGWAYLYASIRRDMDIAARKWCITEQLALITDDGILEQIQHFIKEKLGTDDLTLTELDELDAQEAARLRGDTKMYGREEAMRMMRDGFRG